MCSNKGDKDALGECLRLSVPLIMNAVQFKLLIILVFNKINNILIFERSSNFHGIFLICDTLLL